MKRWFLSALVLFVVLSSIAIVVVRVRLSSQSSSRPLNPSLVDVPNSAYKYPLCGEAYAFSMAGTYNPFKTDDTFEDPFRHVSDTIVPHLLGFDWRNGSGSITFTVDMVIGHVATYHQTITHVQSLDGIALILPDAQHRLQHTTIPQFIVSSVQGTGANSMAVLDFTCSDEWVWKL